MTQSSVSARGRAARQVDLLLEIGEFERATDANGDPRAEASGLRDRIRDALRRAIGAGRLPPGTRLPSSRALAADLGVSRTTVSEAYSQLIAEGWLRATPGGGTWVADRAADPLPVDPIDTGSRLDAIRSYRYNLEPGWPDLAAFPRAAWRRSVDRALSLAPSSSFGYVESRGDPSLRATLADYLARVRGVRAHPEQVLICSGFTQALALLCRVIDEQSGCLAHEQPGHWVHAEVIRRALRAHVPVPVDADGAVIDELAQTPATAVLLTPAHQYPTGAVLTPHRRAAAIEWARSVGGLVVEDDYDGEFQYGTSVGAIQALDPEHVVYCGSLSKSLAPGMRIGWMVLPPAWVEPVTKMKRYTDQQTDSLTQLALADFITSGDYDRHLRRSRLDARERRDELIEALSRAAPWAEMSGERGGLHIVLTWPARAGLPTVAQVHEACRGERMSPPPELDASGSAALGRHGIVVGYAAPYRHDFPDAVQALCRALRTAHASSR